MAITFVLKNIRLWQHSEALINSLARKYGLISLSALSMSTITKLLRFFQPLPLRRTIHGTKKFYRKTLFSQDTTRSSKILLQNSAYPTNKIQFRDNVLVNKACCRIEKSNCFKKCLMWATKWGNITQLTIWEILPKIFYKTVVCTGFREWGWGYIFRLEKSKISHFFKLEHFQNVKKSMQNL